MRFNINAPFWRFMDTLLRFVGLNLVYLITLIPNVTIGPARAALYSTMFAYDEHDDIRLVKEYLTRFKREFKQGLAAWVLVAILATAILFGLVVLEGVGYQRLLHTADPSGHRRRGRGAVRRIRRTVAGTLRQHHRQALLAIGDVPLASLPLLARPRHHRRTRGRPVIFRTVHTRSRHLFGIAWVAYAKSLILLWGFKRYGGTGKVENPQYVNAHE